MTTPIVIDIEASGFGAGSYPIEVGLVLPDGAAHCFLVLPYDEWTQWDEAAEKLHGLKRETVERFGMDGGYVARQLNKHLQGQTVYTDTWESDQAWLDLLFERAGIEPQFTSAPLAEIMTEAQELDWEKTLDEVIAESGLKRHRASADARIVQTTWLKTRMGEAPDAVQAAQE